MLYIIYLFKKFYLFSNHFSIFREFRSIPLILLKFTSQYFVNISFDYCNIKKCFK